MHEIIKNVEIDFKPDFKLPLIKKKLRSLHVRIYFPSQYSRLILRVGPGQSSWWQAIQV